MTEEFEKQLEGIRADLTTAMEDRALSQLQLSESNAKRMELQVAPAGEEAASMFVLARARTLVALQNATLEKMTEAYRKDMEEERAEFAKELAAHDALLETKIEERCQELIENVKNLEILLKDAIADLSIAEDAKQSMQATLDQQRKSVDEGVEAGKAEIAKLCAKMEAKDMQTDKIQEKLVESRKRLAAAEEGTRVKSKELADALEDIRALREQAIDVE
eukprot:gene1598-2235_t